MIKTVTTWTKDTAERVVSSFAEGMLAVLGLDAINVLNADWSTALGVGAGAGVLALLKALAALRIGDPRSASTVPTLVAGTTEPGRHAGH